MASKFTVTLYKLFLGDQQTSPPYHYQRGYSIHSIKVYLFPNGGTFSLGSLGYHSTSNAVAFTKFDVRRGDVIAFGGYYMIKDIKYWTIGEDYQFSSLDLEALGEPHTDFGGGGDGFPFLTGFFGFEDLEHGTIGYGFEEGFERGKWAL